VVFLPVDTIHSNCTYAYLSPLQGSIIAPYGAKNTYRGAVTASQFSIKT